MANYKKLQLPKRASPTQPCESTPNIDGKDELLAIILKLLMPEIYGHFFCSLLSSLVKVSKV